MKKSIFIIAALLAATFANAQITLERTFSDVVQIMTSGEHDGGSSYAIEMPAIQAPYFYLYKKGHPGEGEGIMGYGTAENDKLELYDLETLDLYKTITLPGMMNSIFYVTKNIFTTDGKVALIYDNKIVNEDGNVIYTFDNGLQSFILINAKGTYKLVAYKIGEMGMYVETYIYSLPGNGEAADVDEVSAPQRNTRKYLHNDQVLIDSNEKTYNMKGQVVR